MMLTPVSFQPRGNQVVGLFRLDDFTQIEFDAESTLKQARDLYVGLIENLTKFVVDVTEHYSRHTPLPASVVWNAGDAIHSFEEQLSSICLIIEDLYKHLERDVSQDTELFQRALTFRRYLSDASRIPPDLTWRSCRRGTKRIALALGNGTYTRH